MDFKKIIPCLDVRDGRVVKGVNFVDIKDAGDPVEFAKRYSDAGADEITYLDIMATYEKRKTIIDIIERTVPHIKVPLAVGGGVRTLDDIDDILKAGASKVGINSAAVKDKSIIEKGAEKFGSKAIILAIDYKKQSDGKFTVYTNGARENTGIDAIEWAIECEKLGAGEILPTSIDTDGVRGGYDIEFLKMLTDAVKIPVTASGGCGKIEDFYEVFAKTNVASALAASMFHFGILTVPQVKQYLMEKGVNIKI